MARIGDITIFNSDESVSKTVDITEYEVEKGTPFSDHVRQNNPTFSVSGYIFDDNWSLIETKLEKSMNSGDVLKYVGKFTVNDVVIQSINISGDKTIANGAEISLKLKKIRITKTSYNTPKKKLQKIVPLVKPVTNSGERKQVGPKETPNQSFHTIKKGDTYWYCSQKYGVSVKQLIDWNVWKDPKKLPIGGKMRVA